MLELTGSVTRIGRTSMTVSVEGIAETLLTGQRRPVMSAQFDMVAVDCDGRPTPIKDR